ncbi:MAG: hypothetical protein RR458_06980 [Clostridia bacterium]
MNNLNTLLTAIFGDSEVEEVFSNSQKKDVFAQSGSLTPPKPQVKGIYKVEPKKPEAKSTVKSDHDHPMQKHSMVEMKPKYVGSLGDINTEGCVDHADERYVLKQDDLLNMKSKSKMAEYIIFSEVLGKPKCKR